MRSVYSLYPESLILIFIFLLQKFRTDGFLVPPSCCNNRVATISSVTNAYHVKNNEDPKANQRSLVCRFGAVDGDDDEEDDDYDDDDDDDDDDSPLSKGIDSVSWLPSVDGAKSEKIPIESVKLVRQLIGTFGHPINLYNFFIISKILEISNLSKPPPPSIRNTIFSPLYIIIRDRKYYHFFHLEALFTRRIPSTF